MPIREQRADQKRSCTDDTRIAEIPGALGRLADEADQVLQQHVVERKREAHRYRGKIQSGQFAKKNTAPACRSAAAGADKQQPPRADTIASRPTGHESTSGNA